MRALTLPLAAVLLALGAAGCRQADGPATPRTPVVLITIDTQRADRLGCFGYDAPTSPVLDRLAAESVLFSNHHVQAPLTLPSHSSILTGLLPYHHGVLSNGSYKLSPEARTLPEMLADRGWTTGAVVSAGVLHPEFGLSQGFGTYSWQEEGNTTVSQTDATHATERAVRWLEGLDGSAPPFLWVHYFDPHGPYTAPERFTESGPYDAEVRYTDEQVGVLLQTLQDLGLYDDALLVVTSDHGQHLGEHGYGGHTLSLYEETLHAPLLVRFPGGEHGGREIASLTRSIDILPTVLEALGQELPAELDGVALQQAVLGDGPRQDLESYSETRFAGQQAVHKKSLVRGRWKLITKYNLPADTDVEGLLGEMDLATLEERFPRIRDLVAFEVHARELYDLQADPDEQVNLYLERPDVAARMEEYLAAYRPSDAALPTTEHAPDADMQRQLRELGY
jgi:arylsulfatase A-like enzyme